MAPTESTVERQTAEIIKYLFDDEEDIKDRKLDACLETDSGDAFDPVLIADKLRCVADALNDDYKFKAALSDLKQAAAQEAVEAAFSNGVDLLCQTYIAQRAEVAPEMQLIRASVSFGLYVKKSCPELKNQIRRAMTAFLNRRVGTWVTKQGGWDKVNV